MYNVRTVIWKYSREHFQLFKSNALPQIRKCINAEAQTHKLKLNTIWMDIYKRPNTF